jgi:hypothetical protein
MPVDSAVRPGRTCPLRYRYGAAAIATLAEQSAQTLYVIGGLYGNLPALDAIEAMARAEPGPVTLCFNGDFNWFNVDDEGFRTINERVFRHRFIAGNVEAELGTGGDSVGCGCAYPDSVDDAVVERSNRIHARLQATAARHPDLLAPLEKSALCASAWSMAMPMRWPAGVSTRNASTTPPNATGRRRHSSRPGSTCSPAAIPACPRCAVSSIAGRAWWPTTAPPACPTSAANALAC